jgi:hypothetical protein
MKLFGLETLSIDNSTEQFFIRQTFLFSIISLLQDEIMKKYPKTKK